MTNMTNAGFEKGHELGSYRIEALIGEGGTARVYRASDLRMRRLVALKVLRRGFGDLRDTLRRFQREGQAAAAARHTNVVEVFDVGFECGFHFLALEYVHGVTLRERLDRGPVYGPVALAWAATVARAVEGAHRVGIVHRDLKPQNVMIRNDGVVKLLDFGLSKALRSQRTDETSERLTIPGTILGTLEYMSPEQSRGDVVDGRTDQFSLGSMLYEMLTGWAPFRGASFQEILTAINELEPVPVPHVPEPVSRAVARMLQKDPARRFASMSELARVLERLSMRETDGGSFDDSGAREAIVA